MKKIFIIGILLFCVSIEAFSQEIAYDNLNNTIGVKSSNITGYGFFYNRKISENFRIQFMTFAYYFYNNANKEEHKIWNYDYGFEIQRDLYKINNFRIFVLAGAYKSYDHDTKNYPIEAEKEIKNSSFDAGVGLSCEYFYQRFVIGLDIGYKYYQENRIISEKNYNNGLEYPEVESKTKLGAGIGVGFMF
jgi:hypothetical protein